MRYYFDENFCLGSIAVNPIMTETWVDGEWVLTAFFDGPNHHHDPYRLHRVGKPALYFANGIRQFYQNGKYLSCNET